MPKNRFLALDLQRWAPYHRKKIHGQNTPRFEQFEEIVLPHRLFPHYTCAHPNVHHFFSRQPGTFLSAKVRVSCQNDEGRMPKVADRAKNPVLVNNGPRRIARPVEISGF